MPADRTPGASKTRRCKTSARSSQFAQASDTSRKKGKSRSKNTSPKSRLRDSSSAQETKIQNAIKDYNACEGRDSYEKVANRHGISTTTLYNRIKGITKSRREAHLKQCLLTDDEEAVLVEWAKFLSYAGIPWTYETIRLKVCDIRGVFPSRRWVRRFMKRNSELRPSKGSGLDKKRASSFNFNVVNKYFQVLMKIFGGKIPPCNLWNFDELGIQLGGGRTNNGRVHIFHVKDKSKYRINSDNLELVTVLETVCADGTATVKPFFVFAGKGAQCEEWYEEDDDIFISTSPTGWTNDDICASWFINCFIPQAKRHSNPDYPIVLIYDGHGSHITERMIDAAQENNVLLVLLPAHTTHRLQPCDVGAFGPLKRNWYDLCNIFLSVTRTQVAAKDVVMVYVLARDAAFTPKTLESAWRRSGIGVDSDGFCVCTPDIFSSKDFAPSTSFSTKAHLPQTFPDWDLDLSDLPATGVPDWAVVPELLTQPQLAMEVQMTGFRVDTEDNVGVALSDEEDLSEAGYSDETDTDARVIGQGTEDVDRDESTASEEEFTSRGSNSENVSTQEVQRSNLNTVDVRDSWRQDSRNVAVNTEQVPHYREGASDYSPNQVRELLAERLACSSCAASPLSMAWDLLHEFISPTSSMTIPELHDRMHVLLGPQYHQDDWSEAYKVVCVEPGGDYEAAHSALDQLQIRLRLEGPRHSQEACSNQNSNQSGLQPMNNTRTGSRAESLRASLVNRLSARSGASSSNAAPASAKSRHRSSRHDDPLSDDEKEPEDPDAKLAFYKAQAKRYRTLCESARHQRDRAETHCILARGLVESLQQQLNSKTTKRRRNVKVPSGIISSAEGKKLAHEQALQREEKRLQEQARNNNRALAHAEKLRRRAPGRNLFDFTGCKSLKNMRKADLEDVAWVLGLPEIGTVKEVLGRIEAHFDANPHLRTQPQFVPLFATGTLGRRPRRQQTPPPHFDSASVLGELTNTPKRRRIIPAATPPLLPPPQMLPSLSLSAHSWNMQPPQALSHSHDYLSVPNLRYPPAHSFTYNSGARQYSYAPASGSSHP